MPTALIGSDLAPEPWLWTGSRDVSFGLAVRGKSSERVAVARGVLSATQRLTSRASATAFQ